MDLGLDGKTALVTGASGGIGRAIARRLSTEGVAIVAVARRPDALNDLRSEMELHGGRCEVIVADLSTPAGTDLVLAELRANPTVIDILINNVGGAPPRAMLELTTADWSKTLTRNLLTAVTLCAALVPSMAERGWGRVVNIGSIAAREPTPAIAHYAAAKAALGAYTKALASEVGQKGVTANSVLPGATRTPGFTRHTVDHPEHAERFFGAIGRAGEPDEVAHVVAFLSSMLAGLVTGTTVVVDGGAISAW